MPCLVTQLAWAVLLTESLSVEAGGKAAAPAAPSIYYYSPAACWPVSIAMLPLHTRRGSECVVARMCCWRIEWSSSLGPHAAVNCMLVHTCMPARSSLGPGPQWWPELHAAAESRQPEKEHDTAGQTGRGGGSGRSADEMEMGLG